MATDILALGMCIWEAVTLALPQKDTMYPNKMANFASYFVRPSSMSDAVWHLIKSMCATTPREREDISYTVTKLKQFSCSAMVIQAALRNAVPVHLRYDIRHSAKVYLPP